MSKLNVLVEADGTKLIKVVNFPGGEFAGESMWVEIVDGDENDGRGILRNDAVCSDLKYGDEVAYGGGDDVYRPKYITKE